MALESNRRPLDIDDDARSDKKAKRLYTIKVRQGGKKHRNSFPQ